MDNVHYKDPIDAYIAYLRRAAKSRHISLSEANEKKLSVETAYSYGCTEEDFKFKIPEAIRKAESEVSNESL